MEPVPETERMEEFKSSPLPPLRLQSIPSSNVGSFSPLSPSSASNTFLSPPDPDSIPRKPPNLRRSTDPAPSSPISPFWGPPTSIPYRPRTTSPLSGHHSRSRSAASITPSPMIRTQSMPGVNAAGHILHPSARGLGPRSQSPTSTPSRIRVPRKPVDEAFPPPSPTRTSVLDPERRLSERNSSPNLGVASSSISFGRIRRPASPLRHVSHPNPAAAGPSTPSSIASSPYQRPYDSLSSGFGFAASMPSSSIPSTPTSARSRSPSISSLETIPDSPDAEEAALEAERIAQLKAAADAAESGGDGKGKQTQGGLDVPSRGRTLAAGLGSRDKRKRWSVCGAERRADLDLETIWED